VAAAKKAGEECQLLHSMDACRECQLVRGGLVRGGGRSSMLLDQYPECGRPPGVGRALSHPVRSPGYFAWKPFLRC